MLAARLMGNGERGMGSGESGIGNRESGAGSREIDAVSHSPFPTPHSPLPIPHIDRAYTRMLEWSMAHRRIIGALSVMAIIGVIPLFMFTGKNFLPEDDQAQFEITVRAPADRSLTATMTVMERIADPVRRLPGVTDTLTRSEE